MTSEKMEPHYDTEWVSKRAHVNTRCVHAIPAQCQQGKLFSQAFLLSVLKCDPALWWNNPMSLWWCHCWRLIVNVAPVPSVQLTSHVFVMTWLFDSGKTRKDVGEVILCNVWKDNTNNVLLNPARYSCYLYSQSHVMWSTTTAGSCYWLPPFHKLKSSAYQHQAIWWQPSCLQVF